MLRIWISNTVENQPWQNGGLAADSFEFGSKLESSYRVKIEGRLLDDDDSTSQDEEDDVDGAGAAKADRMDEDKPKPKTNGPQAPRLRFSHFFRAITVDFDRTRSQTTAEPSIEWKKPERSQGGPNAPPVADFDEFTFKRNGDENVNITINLFRHEEPERFLLSPDLAAIVDMREATRTDIVMSLWEYIKLNNLQEDEEKRNFRCDDLLKRVCLRCPDSTAASRS